MIKQGKLWGDTTEILNLPNFKQHIIRCRKGWRCSEHYHKFGTNWFFIISGKMNICRWKENGVVDNTILGAGEQTIVPPNEWHVFEVMEDCVALEAYWSKLPEEDIIRRTQGGKIDEHSSIDTSTC
tara:strand:- start:888 stop:1265 length:378 start_codon:yes stop_codon:yes gene_type:complete